MLGIGFPVSCLAPSPDVPCCHGRIGSRLSTPPPQSEHYPTDLGTPRLNSPGEPWEILLKGVFQEKNRLPDERFYVRLARTIRPFRVAGGGVVADPLDWQDVDLALEGPEVGFQLVLDL